MFDIATACLVLTAILAYFNRRYVGLPTTIGVMVIALALSFVLIGLNALGVTGLHEYEASLLASIDFSDVLMQGMLSLLLFAGALHVDMSELREHRVQVGVLAVLGTLLSTVFVAVGLWFVLPIVGLSLPFTYCLVFGALISPTDPIAVMGILRTAGVPRSLEIVIAGESLFNDGIGVVLFSLVSGMIQSGETPTLSHGLLLLAEEAGGGLLFGLALGYVAYWMLKSIDSYQEEVMLTLAAVLGGYSLANHIHVSGPLAIVVAGLVIGNHGRALAMSTKTRHHVDMFWELLDEMLNAVLFVLIGLEVVVIQFHPAIVAACGLVVLLVLLARLCSVGLPMALARGSLRLPKGAWQVLTWGGLRGGISVALALSLRPGAERDTVLTLTYAVVLFSIIVQGLSIGRVARAVTIPSSPRMRAQAS
ncbi:MAG: sodium:proton antiporter [Vicinamibacteria bacterium]